MKKQLSLSATALYIAFMLIGPHGPFVKHHKADDQHHTHKKHVVKLLRNEEKLSLQPFKHRYIPLSA